jgi:hypothetical protein
VHADHLLDHALDAPLRVVRAHPPQIGQVPEDDWEPEPGGDLLNGAPTRFAERAARGLRSAASR